ncbi:MAG: hypothetical protein AAGA23_09125 [Pseudomonadota bacterium]
MSEPGNTPSVADLLLDSGRGKPAFLSQVNADQLVDVVLRLAMEVSALRERLDAHEALAREHGLGADAVDQFQPDEALAAEQKARRERWVARIVHDLTT